MYKKISFILLAFCFSLISCDPIENNSRIAFELKVTDDENQPISDIDINVSLRDTSSNFSSFILPFSDGFEALIGFGSTDAQGEVFIISLDPDLRSNEIAVIINGSEELGESSINEDYGNVVYLIDSEEDRTTVLPNTVLKRLGTLEVEIIDIPGIEADLDYSITYATRIQQFRFPSGEESISETIEEVGIPSQTDMFTFETLQNTTAIFTYFLTSSTGTVETNTIEIPINQETVQYVFEF